MIVTGCMGPCEPWPRSSSTTPTAPFYPRVTALDVPELVEEHFVKGRPCQRLLPKGELGDNVITTQRDFAFLAKTNQDHPRKLRRD